MNILITGGRGFIGSNLVRYILKNISFIDKIVILDNLYSGNIIYILCLSRSLRVNFIKRNADISRIAAEIGPPPSVKSIEGLVHTLEYLKKDSSNSSFI